MVVDGRRFVNPLVVVILGAALLGACTARNPAWLGPGSAGNPGGGTGGHAAGNGGASGNGGTAAAESGTDAAAGDNGVAGASGSGGTPATDGGAGNGAAGASGVSGTDAAPSDTSIDRASGSGGIGGAPGTDAGAGAGGVSGAGGTSDGGSNDAPVCAESPCGLVMPQCGCDTGEQCSIVGTNRKCVTAGTVAEGQSCSGNLTCAPGLICVGLSAGVSTCQQFCGTDADCAAGALCTKTLSDGSGGKISVVKLCSRSCNPVGSMGCPVVGTACQLEMESSGAMRYFTDCVPSGTKTAGQSCDPANGDCAPGYLCTASGHGNSCFQYCDPASAAACPTCTSLMSAGGGPLSYGVCE
jgi:hypothetical protein